MQCSALKIIINSKKIDDDTKRRAQGILNEELRHIKREKDILEEKALIRTINVSVLYNEQTSVTFSSSSKSTAPI